MTATISSHQFTFLSFIFFVCDSSPWSSLTSFNHVVLGVAMYFVNQMKVDFCVTCDTHSCNVQALTPTSPSGRYLLLSITRVRLAREDHEKKKCWCYPCLSFYFFFIKTKHLAHLHNYIEHILNSYRGTYDSRRGQVFLINSLLFSFVSLFFSRLTLNVVTPYSR